MTAFNPLPLPPGACGDPYCIVCSARRDPTTRAARCTCGLVSSGRFGNHESHCEMMKGDRVRDPFPSLSLMQKPARGFSTVTIPPITKPKAELKPEGAPHPTIWPIGDGKWCCRYMPGGECNVQDRQCHPVGFGSSPTYAWNAWVVSWLAHKVFA